MPELNLTVREELAKIRKNAQRTGISADEQQDAALAAVADDAERLTDGLLAVLDRYGDQHWHGAAIPSAPFPELQVDETGACRTCWTLRLVANALGLDARMPDDEAWDRARVRMQREIASGLPDA